MNLITYDDKYYFVSIMSTLISSTDHSHIIEYLTGRHRLQRKLQEERSVSIPLSSDLEDYNELKIKGCGNRGKKILFGVQHEGGPESPHFDYEGRFSEDVARGHNAACSGGMSYQQAHIEHKAVTYLCSRGFKTVPSAGYGYIIEKKSGFRSWFSLLLWRNTIERFKPYSRSPEWRIRCAREMSQAQIDLALDYHIVPYFSPCVEDKSIFMVDFHSSKYIHPINDSDLSVTMYLIFSFQIYLRWYQVFDRYLPMNCGTQKDRKIAENESTVAWFDRILPDVTYEQVIDFRERIFPLKIVNRAWLAVQDDKLSGRARRKLLESNAISSEILSLTNAYA